MSGWKDEICPEALKACGTNPNRGRSALLLLADDYDEDVDFKRLAIELGLRPERLSSAIPGLSNKLRPTLSLLEEKAIALKRSDLEIFFEDLGREVYAVLKSG